MAKEYYHHVLIHNLENGLPISLSGPYDMVIASHVLEHICYPEKLLRDIAERLTEDGILIVALPNLLNWRFRFKMFIGEFDCASVGIMDNTHYRWYTFQSAWRILETNGLEVVHARADGYFPLPGVRKLGLRRIARRIDAVACKALPGLFDFQLLYIARKGRGFTR